MIWFLNRTKKKFFSKIHGTITIKSSYGHKTLFTENIPQSGGEFVFMWEKLIANLKHQNFPILNCLILGVGGGSVIKSIYKKYPAAKIKAIEIDPVMIQIAKEEFSIFNSSSLQISQTDACRWIKNQTIRNQYDVIIVDLFTKDLNPRCARGTFFLHALKRLLKREGIVLYNAHFQIEREEEYIQFQENCVTNFKKVTAVFSYKKNRVLRLQN